LPYVQALMLQMLSLFNSIPPFFIWVKDLADNNRLSQKRYVVKVHSSLTTAARDLCVEYIPWQI
jgi:hypothetical protein